MRDAAGMPKLNDNGSAFEVHGVGDRLPASDLIVRIATRCVRVALRLGRDLRGFGDDQAGRGALGVVVKSKWTRDQAGSRAISRERAMTIRFASFRAPACVGSNRARAVRVW